MRGGSGAGEGRCMKWDLLKRLYLSSNESRIIFEELGNCIEGYVEKYIFF